MSIWVGVNSSENSVFSTDLSENLVDKKHFPQFDYVVGPFDSKDKAAAYAKTHSNVDGTFVDPFCNNGGGR